MKGWYEASGLDSALNNKTACQRKRHFTKRGAEEAEKHSRNKSNKLFRYQCPIRLEGDLNFHFHLTSLPQRRDS